MAKAEIGSADAVAIALAAQGFAARRPAKPGRRHLLEVARRLSAIQIDSVNALCRAHYLPFFSRLGAYPTATLDRLVNTTHDLAELDAHQASFSPVELEPLLRDRRLARTWRRGWRERVEASRPGYTAEIEATIAARGPVSLRDLDDPGRRPKPSPEDLTVRRKDGKPYAATSIAWARGSFGKDVLDGLLHDGHVMLAGRSSAFDRLYDLAERVVPAEVRRRPTPPDDERHVALVRLAARALGVATVADLAGYFTLKQAPVRTAARVLVDAGHIVPAVVEGWKEPAYLWTGAERLRPSGSPGALLGPFDSLTWSRPRTQRLFGFEFSFEIYVPEAKRRFGYYVLPFLLGDRLVARLDLKADRPAGTLVVGGAFAEEDVDVLDVAGALAPELRTLSRWLGLDDVRVGRRGDLSAELRRALHGA